MSKKKRKHSKEFKLELIRQHEQDGISYYKLEKRESGETSPDSPAVPGRFSEETLSSWLEYIDYYSASK